MSRPGAVMLGELTRLAINLADRAVVSDIECNAVREELEDSPHKWWNTQPMLDPREHDNSCIDMAQQALAYARMRGLVLPHPRFPHLVRITRQP